MTEVVAALIIRNGRILICRRPPEKARGLLWEFVGGKVEYGETKKRALKRECREELEVEVQVGKRFMSVVHEYPDLKIRLTVYWAEITAGEPHPTEHVEIRWISPDEIPSFEFCPADTEILEKILTLANTPMPLGDTDENPL